MSLPFNDEISEFPSLFMPQSLRKSTSVDSFAQYNLDHWQNHPLLQHSRGATQTQQDRLRGESLSFVQRGPNRQMDADGDRYDPLSHTDTECYRHGLSKTQDATKPAIRAGDLPLPSRAINNTNTFCQQASDRPLSSRNRSGSVGSRPNPLLSSILLNTNVPPSNSHNDDIVLLVLGTRGCGKSTLIQSVLSGANLGESFVISENPLYVCRLAYVGSDSVNSRGRYPHVLRVVEGDILSSTTDLPPWPSHLPPIDGVILCYDSTDQASFRPIEDLLKGYRALNLPVVVLHCKVDLAKDDGSGVNLREALAKFKEYDTGLIQVSTVDPSLKSKMGKSMDYILMVIFRQRGSNRVEDYRNPASPSILDNCPPLPSPIVSPQVQMSDKSPDEPTPDIPQQPPDIMPDDAVVPQINPNQQDSPAEVAPAEQPISPQSTSLQNIATSEARNPPPDNVSDGDDSLTEGESMEQKDPPPLSGSVNVAPRQVKHGHWTHLDELLDRLLFIAISEEDPNFVSNFFLIYRRFSTPRNVLLAMQKRLRLLDDPSGDPMFACYAQMRVCDLLETWIREYPNDFAVKGTPSALTALITSITSKTHLLHYASEFLPFTEQLPGLCEEDTAWALKTDTDTDSESYCDSEDDENRVEIGDMVADAASGQTSSSSEFVMTTGERGGLSLASAKTLFPTSPQPEPTPKQLLKDLIKLSGEVLTFDSDDIAKEITRQCVELFLKIKPRDWIDFTFTSQSRRTESNSIGEYNSSANYLANWVSCLILCHDQPRQRARQVEKLVEIAVKIRQLNNYSGLRAFVAGINMATDDVTLEAFKMKSPEAAKNLLSWDVLLKQLRSHRAYRLALRNSKGGCIPALEVHMQDLLKANEGNLNQREDDPMLIHWGKFNMLARFIGTISQCQSQCRSSAAYTWTERRDIGELLRRRTLLTVDVQHERLNIPEQSDNSIRDARVLRKWIFW